MLLLKLSNSLADVCKHGFLCIYFQDPSVRSVPAKLLSIVRAVVHLDQNLQRRTPPKVLPLIPAACGFPHLREENPTLVANQSIPPLKTKSNHEMGILGLVWYHKLPVVLVVFLCAYMRCNRLLCFHHLHEQPPLTIGQYRKHSNHPVQEYVLLDKPIARLLAKETQTLVPTFHVTCTSHMEYPHLLEKHTTLQEEAGLHQNRLRANDP